MGEDIYLYERVAGKEFFYVHVFSASKKDSKRYVTVVDSIFRMGLTGSEFTRPGKKLLIGSKEPATREELVDFMRRIFVKSLERGLPESEEIEIEGSMKDAIQRSAR